MIDNTCPFCTLPQERVVLENEGALAFYDLFPVQRGHMLVIPKRHVATYFDASEQDIAAIHRLLVDAKQRVDSEFQPDGYNLGVNIGKYAGQTVFHLHFHLIPRFKGDVPDPRGGVRNAIPHGHAESAEER